MGPEDVRACAEKEQGSLARKLEDVAAILAAYEREIAGRFEDGEGELSLAAEKAADAAFLRGAKLWFYGFDMMPPTLHSLIAAVAAMGEATALLPLESGRGAPATRTCSAPCAPRPCALRKRRASATCASSFPKPGTGETLPGELRFLSTELFSTPARGWTEATRSACSCSRRAPRARRRALPRR